MVTQVKSAIPTVRAVTDPAVAATVAGILDDVRSRGDAAVREYSEKFDKWSPESFRLSPEQITERSGTRCTTRMCRSW
jgi:sulfopropanediol 3-dehydrogenase